MEKLKKPKHYVDLPKDVWDGRIWRDETQKEILDMDEKELKFDTEGKRVNIFYQEGTPTEPSEGKPDILLLHGMKFDSQTWYDLGTMHLATKMGHRTIAVDLPGYGNSKGVTVTDTAEFLTNFIAELGLDRPIIVSPSMSGTYSLPYLMSDPETASERASGFIPVAPVSTDKYKDQYKKCQLPTLILSGSNDAAFGTKPADNLSSLPHHVSYVMDGCGHACYMDNPDDWHRIFYNFLKNMSSS